MEKGGAGTLCQTARQGAGSVEGILRHGTGYGGQMPAKTACMSKRINVVLGHCHSRCSIWWHASERDCIFGMSVGCGIDIKHPAFDYAKHHKDRPLIAAGIVQHTEFGNILPIVETILMF